MNTLLVNGVRYVLLGFEYNISYMIHFPPFKHIRIGRVPLVAMTQFISWRDILELKYPHRNAEGMQPKLHSKLQDP